MGYGYGYELTHVTDQIVQPGANVLFDANPVRGARGVSHRAGAGIITLSGNCSRCVVRHEINFNANIAIPTGGTVEAISLALALEGEPLGSTTMIVTPAAVEDLWNVSASVIVDTLPCAETTVTVRNTSTQPVTVANANLIVD